jgi:hypothetical protein
VIRAEAIPLESDLALASNRPVTVASIRSGDICFWVPDISLTRNSGMTVNPHDRNQFNPACGNLHGRLACRATKEIRLQYSRRFGSMYLTSFVMV